MGRIQAWDKAGAVVNVVKQVIVIRKDLGMSIGKTAAQASHASLGSYKKSDAKTRSEWERIGCKKVVLKARDEREIEDIELKCQKNGVACFVVRDAGLTELSPGTVTAIGIGPEKDEKIDRITGSLPLLD